jgi:hypothetical protein
MWSFTCEICLGYIRLLFFQLMHKIVLIRYFKIEKYIFCIINGNVNPHVLIECKFGITFEKHVEIHLNDRK